MATVLDAMVVTLGLDASKFTAGSKDADAALKSTRDTAARTGKDMAADGKKAAEFFARIKTEALGLIGVLAGGIGLKDLISSATNSMAGLGREARSIGVAVPALAAFSYVMQQNGASAESARQSVMGLAAQIENFKVYGDPHVLRFLAPIGATPDESPLEIMKKFVEFSLAHKNDPNLVNLIGAGLGFSPDVIRAVEQLKSLAEYQRDLNAAQRDAPTALEAANSEQLQKAWYHLDQTAKGLRNTMVSDLTPAMTEFLRWSDAEIEANPKVAEGITAVVAAFAGMAALRFGAIFLGLRGVAGAIGVVVGVAEKAVGVLGLLASLSGDTNKGPGAKEAPGSEFFGANGALAHWGWNNLPQWLGGKPATPPITSAAARANEQAVRQYFLQQGYTPDQVAGLLANMADESGFNPATIGDHGQAYGLFQWHPDRQREFRLMFGHDIQHSTLREQLEFAQWELTHTEKAAGDKLRAARTPFAAGVAVAGYLRPAGGSNTAIYRGNQAAAYAPPPRGPLVYGSGNPMVGGTTTVHINALHVHSKATDAAGIAKDVRAHLSRELTVQANRGIQ